MIKTKYAFVLIATLYNSLFFAQFSHPELLHPNIRFLSIHNENASRILLNAKSDYIQLDSLITSNLDGYESKHSFKYNENNRLVEWLWNSGWKDQYVYNESNNLVTKISLELNNAKWDTLARINFFYIGNKISEMTIGIIPLEK